MLTEKEARKIGVDACIDKIGRDFVDACEDTVYGWGETENGLYCYVGVDDTPLPELEEKPDQLVLDSTSQYPYRASCIVNLESGALTFMEVVRPSA